MRKPKVLCLSALPPPHHGTSVANEILLTSETVRHKFDLTVIPLNKPELQFGGRLSRQTLVADLEVTLNFWHVLIRLRPQLTYLCLAQTRFGLYRDLMWIGLATRAGSKCLAHMHGGNYRNFFENTLSQGERQFFLKALRRLSGVIVLDSTLSWLFKGLVADSRIFPLRNGIPDYFAHEIITQAIHRRGQTDRLQVTYLSNMVEGKGFDTFLETAVIIKKRGKEQEFVFNLAGAPANTETAVKVEETVQSHGLQNMVRILGKVVDQSKWDLLLESDVFVFPTRYIPEGQPFAIIEAMAAGLPVISTARGCIPAMVSEGVNGFIVPEKAPAAIAQRLERLQTERELRLSMSRASRARYLESYTAEKFIQGFAAILDQVLEGN